MADAQNIEMGRRELAHRSADGVEVTLLWNPVSDAISVRVIERDTEACFELAVARDQALKCVQPPVRVRRARRGRLSGDSPNVSRLTSAGIAGC